MSTKTLSTKTKLALAVAGFAVAGAANAAPEFYGNLNSIVEYRMMENNDTYADHADLQDSYSRLGVKGSHDLGNGLSAIYKYEMYTNATNGNIGDNDDVYVGLSGDFGTLTMGNLWSPYYNAVGGKTDLFSTYWSGFDTYSSFRIDDSIAFSKSMGALSVEALIAMEGAEDSKDGGDYSRGIVGVTFSASDALSFGVAYDQASQDGDESDDLVGLTASFSAGDFGLSVVHEMADKGAGYAVAEDGEAESGSVSSVGVTFGPFTALYATGDYGYVAEGSATGETVTSSEIGLGFATSLSDNVTYVAEYHSSADTCAPTGDAYIGSGATEGNGCSVVATGLRVSF